MSVTVAEHPRSSWTETPTRKHLHKSVKFYYIWMFIHRTMSLPWTWKIPGFNGIQIEANRVDDAKTYLGLAKDSDFKIYDPSKGEDVIWKEASFDGLLKFWDEEMTLAEKVAAQQARFAKYSGPSYTPIEVINI